MLILKGGTIVTLGEDCRVIEDGAVSSIRHYSCGEKYDILQNMVMGKA